MPAIVGMEAMWFTNTSLEQHYSTLHQTDQLYILFGSSMPLPSVTLLTQSCIRHEVLAALEELSAVTLLRNETEIEELNNTMRAGFKDTELKVQSCQKSLKEEHHREATKMTS